MKFGAFLERMLVGSPLKSHYALVDSECMAQPIIVEIRSY